MMHDNNLIAVFDIYEPVLIFNRMRAFLRISDLCRFVAYFLHYLS